MNGSPSDVGGTIQSVTIDSLTTEQISRWWSVLKNSTAAQTSWWLCILKSNKLHSTSDRLLVGIWMKERIQWNEGLNMKEETKNQEDKEMYTWISRSCSQISLTPPLWFVSSPVWSSSGEKRSSGLCLIHSCIHSNSRPSTTGVRRRRLISRKPPPPLSFQQKVWSFHWKFSHEKLLLKKQKVLKIHSTRGPFTEMTSLHLYPQLCLQWAFYGLKPWCSQRHVTSHISLQS